MKTLDDQKEDETCEYFHLNEDVFKQKWAFRKRMNVALDGVFKCFFLFITYILFNSTKTNANFFFLWMIDPKEKHGP